MDDQSKQNNQSALTENSPVGHLTAPKICHNPHCSFQTHELMSKCPKCGRPIWTTNEFRLIMSSLLLLGFILLLAGVGFGIVAYRTYNGTVATVKNEESLAIIMSFLALFFSMFGLSVMAAGAWAVIFGRANWRLVKIVLSFMVGLLLIAGFGRLVLYLLLD